MAPEDSNLQDYWDKHFKRQMKNILILYDVSHSSVIASGSRDYASYVQAQRESFEASPLHQRAQ